MILVIKDEFVITLVSYVYFALVNYMFMYHLCVLESTVSHCDFLLVCPLVLDIKQPSQQHFVTLYQAGYFVVIMSICIIHLMHYSHVVGSIEL